MIAYSTAIEALADPTRRGIFEQLRAGEKAVGQLAAGLPVSRPAVSQHLKVLKQAGLVRERREGTRRVYGVELHGLIELRRYLDGFWRDAIPTPAPTPAPVVDAPVQARPIRRYEPKPFNVEED